MEGIAAWTIPEAISEVAVRVVRTTVCRSIWPTVFSGIGKRARQVAVQVVRAGTGRTAERVAGEDAVEIARTGAREMVIGVVVTATPQFVPEIMAGAMAEVVPSVAA